MNGLIKSAFILEHESREWVKDKEMKRLREEETKGQKDEKTKRGRVEERKRQKPRNPLAINRNKPFLERSVCRLQHHQRKLRLRCCGSRRHLRERTAFQADTEGVPCCPGALPPALLTVQPSRLDSLACCCGDSTQPYAKVLWVLLARGVSSPIVSTFQHVSSKSILAWKAIL